MNSLENLKLKGKVNIVVTDPSGAVKDSREIKNLVVNSGLGFITSRMTGTASAVMSHMELGTSTVAAAAEQTGLLAPLGTAGSNRSTVTVTPGATSVQYSASFAGGAPASGTNAITEAGIFNASTGGDMLCRTTFAAINKAPLDTMTVTWTINLVAAS